MLKVNAGCEKFKRKFENYNKQSISLIKTETGFALL